MGIRRSSSETVVLLSVFWLRSGDIQMTLRWFRMMIIGLLVLITTAVARTDDGCDGCCDDAGKQHDAQQVRLRLRIAKMAATQETVDAAPESRGEQGKTNNGSEKEEAGLVATGAPLIFHVQDGAVNDAPGSRNSLIRLCIAAGKGLDKVIMAGHGPHHIT